jgi:methylmalonyl-CoA/ethylmalonyl-CoA epimerase
MLRMMTSAHPNHVALLVRSVERSAALLRSSGLDCGEAEFWEGEGTKEIYVGRGGLPSLLLMEAVSEGAYSRALAKRGPGLHHLAVDVSDVAAFLPGASAAGWELHPRSAETLARTKTAWLFRRGFPSLIEVQERAVPAGAEVFVNRLELPMALEFEKLLVPLGLAELVDARSPEAALHLHGQRFRLAALVGA